MVNSILRTNMRRIFTGLFLCVLGFSVSGANAQNTSDPCPEPKRAMNETPNNMARVQEDINRFILCVERAQLLERLNTLVEKNVETIDSVLLQPTALPILPTTGNMSDFPGSDGSSSNSSSNSGGQSQTMQPVNESDLAPSDMPGSNSGASSSMGNGTGDFPDGSSEPAEEPKITWLIREIYGKSGSLQARLVNSDGRLARAGQGDVLPDESRIIEISKTRIRIKQDEDVVELDWVNDTPEEEE